MSDDLGIGLEHLLAGAIVANGGELVFDVEHMLSDEIVGKQINLSVEDGVATITLTEVEETE